MSIESELKSHIKQNDYAINIIKADDLIAAWCFQKNNKFKRSYDFSKVPTEYRYSAPPSEKDTCMACHVSFKSTGGSGAINPNQVIKYGGTAACHQSHIPDMRRINSIDELQAVDFVKRNISPYISPIMDAVTLARVTKDLGITGKVSTKIINNRQYIVFGGMAGLLVGTVITYAAVPILLSILVGVGVSGKLENIDSQYGLTAKLVTAIEQKNKMIIQKKKEMENKLCRILSQAEEEFFFRAYGVDINKPLSLQSGFRYHIFMSVQLEMPGSNLG